MDDERGIDISGNAGFSMYEDEISEEPYDGMLLESNED